MLRPWCVFWPFSQVVSELKIDWTEQCLVLVGFLIFFFKAINLFLKWVSCKFEKARKRKMSDIWREKWKCLWWVIAPGGTHSCDWPPKNFIFSTNKLYLFIRNKIIENSLIFVTPICSPSLGGLSYYLCHTSLSVLQVKTFTWFQGGFPV